MKLHALAMIIVVASVVTGVVVAVTGAIVNGIIIGVVGAGLGLVLAIINFVMVWKNPDKLMPKLGDVPRPPRPW